MLKSKLLIKFLSSGLQSFSVQILGSLFFYYISVYLPKNDFGTVNLMNAIALLLTTLLGFGLEQVMVRRVASSNKSDWAAAAFFLHAIAGSLITIVVLFILSQAFWKPDNIYQNLLWFFAAQALVYIGVPVKQFLNAKEKFTPYGVIAAFSNVFKIAAVYFLLKNNLLNIRQVSLILICAAGFELCLLLIYVLTKVTLSFKLRFKAYINLIKESSAQYLSVIFDMSLSRMDWILLGVMATSTVLADYSFAYRAYELARLPMLIIAPIILPRLSRLMASTDKLNTEEQLYINSLSTVELFFAVSIPLTLNILWTPLIGLLTNYKYGNANSWQFMILSLCIPLQFFINLLWSLSFSAKMYKQVTVVTIFCAVTNLALNFILIPYYQGIGAAIAFFITSLLQTFLLYRLVNKHIMQVSILPFAAFAITGAGAYIFSTRLSIHFLWQLAVAVIIYLLIALLTKLVTKQHLHHFKFFLTR